MLWTIIRGYYMLQLTRMFELVQPVAPRKRSLFSWLGAACILSALLFTIASNGYNPIEMLLIIGGNILVIVDARQKKEHQLPHFLPQ